MYYRDSHNRESSAQQQQGSQYRGCTYKKGQKKVETNSEQIALRLKPELVRKEKEVTVARCCDRDRRNRLKIHPHS